MVLATDEVYTYAIFNYDVINWSAHTEAGGDTTHGEGGVPAFVSTLLLFCKIFCCCFFYIFLSVFVFFNTEKEQKKSGF